MAKNGLKAKNAISKRSDFSLNKEVAAALVKLVVEQGKMFSEEHWRTNKPVVLETRSGSCEIKPRTYHAWIVRSEIVPGTGITLRAMIKEARQQRLIRQHEAEKQSVVLEAQKLLKQLQSLPLGTVTKKKSSKSGYNDRDGDYKETSEEVVESPINTALVGHKLSATKFVLQSLDPAYTQKTESKNLHAHVSLKELRQAAEAEAKQFDHDQ